MNAALDGDELVLSQQRFSFGDASEATTWLVPVIVRNGDTTERVLLEEVPVRVPLANPQAIIVVNAGGHGFYRVAYSAQLRDRLSGEALAALDTLERYTLVDDAWAEVTAGRLSGPEFLAFVEGFGDERELAVWQAILVGLRGLGRFLGDDDYPRFQARVATLLRPVVADLGDPVDGESDLTGKLRGLVTASLAVLGADPPTVERCRQLYDASVAPIAGQRGPDQCEYGIDLENVADSCPHPRSHWRSFASTHHVGSMTRWSQRRAID